MLESRILCSNAFGAHKQDFTPNSTLFSTRTFVVIVNHYNMTGMANVKKYQKELHNSKTDNVFLYTVYNKTDDTPSQYH